MTRQISFFDGNKPYKINKPIRLIELFGGYGSQHFALEYLGANFQQWKLCEWAVKSIQAYKDAHFKDDNTDYSKDLSKEELIEYLANKGISANYNEPMTKEQVKRLGEDKLRTIYNNIMATHNLVNIQQVKGEDLEIVDTDKYEYIITYSFPCQDLSLAGLGKGMEKGSGTRSGMLWEVERILDEIYGRGYEQLPQVLLMENVPEVIGTNNIKSFASWLAKLESLGYKCYWKVLNAKDYGIPQNRERCFMVSVLGDYYYQFPQPIKLDKKLKDLLEENVDENYYLSDNAKIYTFDCNRVCDNSKRGDIGDRKVNPQIAKTISCRGATGQRADVTNFVVDNNEKEYTLNDIREQLNKKRSVGCAFRGRYNNDGNIEQKFEMLDEEISNALTAIFGNKINLVAEEKIACEIRSDEGIRTFNDNSMGTLRTIDACGDKHIIETNNLRIRKLTPRECFRLMGVKDKDFELIAENQSNASLYHLAGDSIVVAVLVAIFGQMLDSFDFNEYIEEFYKEIGEEIVNMN